MLHRLSKTQIVVVWSAVCLAGVAAGWRGERAERERMIGALTDDAQRAAAAFDPVDLRLLTGARADMASSVYPAVKQRLMRLQAISPHVRFVRLFRFLPESGRLIMLADSAPAGARVETLPGDAVPAAAQSAGVQAIIRNGQATTDGPFADNAGTWVVGYALAAERPSDQPDLTTKDIVGIDFDTADWNHEQWGAAFSRAFYMWILLGLPFGALLVLRREFEQREAIRNLSEAMEQSHSALMIVDLESRIEYANRGLCRQIGYTRRELIGRSWREFQVADTPPERLAELVSTVRSGHTWEGEWFNRRKDGTTYPVRGIVTPVKDGHGALACFIAVFDDVTEIKRQAAELREARDLAQAGDRAKGQFLATMSHEVRTPLNGIVGFTNLLLGTPLTAEQRDCVETIRTSGEALIQLTTDILDYARIESGRLKLDPLPWDPRECVEDALGLFAATAAQKKLELLHSFAPEVPAAIVTDGGRLRQILINLVSNAVKFTDAGEIEVTLAMVPDVKTAPGVDGKIAAAAHPPTVMLRFAVRDTGHGLDEQERAQLFRPFTQLDGSLTRKHGGTGLGLAICKNLVQQLGGEINCVSAPGAGATFSFTLHAPVATPPPTPPDLRPARLALVAKPGPLRRELAQLFAHWRAAVIERDELAALGGAGWDTALVEVDEAFAATLTAAGTPPGRHAHRMIALVPMTLNTETRHALRPHFHLLLNKPANHAALLAAIGGQRPVAPAPTVSANPFGFSVLVVEDNAVNQRFMQRALARLGCTSRIVGNGRDALAELARTSASYDLVLLDIHMPEMDGIAALKRIRGGEAGAAARSMWIAIVTADTRSEQRASALTEGADEFLAKPLQLSDLEAALRRFRAARGAAKA